MKSIITHVVQRGESLYQIAKKFGLTVNVLLVANPSIKNPSLIMPGQVINIPKVNKTIVVPRKQYGYDEMMSDLDTLSKFYPFIKVSTIGKTVAGRSIPAVQIGRGAKEVHYNGSFHANEWITTLLLMKFIEAYAKAYQEGRYIGHYKIKNLFEKTTLWIVPMVNPDGVELVQNGIQPTDPFYDTVVGINRSSGDFSGWKANLRGVDLNDQFPARWEEEVARRASTGPAPRDYPGPSPLSEPESKAMADFTRSHNFRLVMAFHTQGEEIYWGYRGLEPTESHRIVQLFSEVSGGYQPIQYVESDAGYKDWFIQEWRRPGFTVECGQGTNPLPFAQFWDIWGQVIGIFLVGLDV